MKMRRRSRRKEAFEVMEIWVPARNPAAWMGFMAFPRQRRRPEGTSSSVAAAKKGSFRFLLQNKGQNHFLDFRPSFILP